MEDAIEWLQQNPDCLVELTLVTDTFFNRPERKQIECCTQRNCYNDSGNEFAAINKKSIDLSKNMNELFRDYSNIDSQEPNKEIMELPDFVRKKRYFIMLKKKH